MKTGEATASPLCSTGPAWFLWRSLKTAPPSTELDHGSQVGHPQRPHDLTSMSEMLLTPAVCLGCCSALRKVGC